MDKRRAAIASKKADHDTVEKSKQQGDRQKREREEGPERNGKMTAKKVQMAPPRYIITLDDAP